MMGFYRKQMVLKGRLNTIFSATFMPLNNLAMLIEQLSEDVPRTVHRQFI